LKRGRLEHYATVNWPAASAACVHSCHPRTASGPNTKARHTRLCARISYQPGPDPAEVAPHLMASAEFAADMDGFDVNNIVDVPEVFLTPAAVSPAPPPGGTGSSGALKAPDAGA
jgi:hypothetical protein